MSICVIRGTNPNEIYQESDFKGKSVKDIAKILSLDNPKNISYHSPIYQKRLELSDVPLRIYPELVLEKRPEKYPPPEYYLFIMDNEDDSDLYLYFNIKTQIDTDFPRMGIQFKSNEIKSLKGSDVLERAIKTFGYECSDQKIIYSGSVIDGSKSMKQIIDKSIKNKEPITFECDVDDRPKEKIKHRIFNATQIITTENSYINDLKEIVEYWDPEFKKSNLFTDDEYRTLFRDVPTIMASHSVFLQSLPKPEDVKFSTEMGTKFLAFAQFFKVSGTFVSQYKQVDEMIKQKSKSSSFKLKMKEIENNLPSGTGRDFLSYYITPVQRYPRYPLLIRDLIKCTPDFHPDKYYLTKALYEIDNANKKLDDTSHKIKQLVEIEDIEKDTNHCIAEEGREFIMKKNVKIVKPKNQAAVLYLFNDIVFLAIKTKKGQQIIFGNKIEFINVENFQFCNDRPTPDSIIAYIFQKEYTITFESYSEKAVWMDAFNKVRVNQLSVISETKNFAKWTDLEIGEQNYPLTGHDGVVFKNKVYFVGGLNQSNSINQNLVIYDIDNDKWSSEPATGLPPRSFHACGTYNDYIYVFFGQGSRNALGDIWRTQGGEWTKVPAPANNQRYGHSIVFYNDLFYIFGGRNGEKILNDVLIFNPEKNDIKTVEPAKGSKVPSGRYYHSASVYHDKMIIYGGKTVKGISSDIYYFNFTTNSANLCANTFD